MALSDICSWLFILGGSEDSRGQATRSGKPVHLKNGRLKRINRLFAPDTSYISNFSFLLRKLNLVITQILSCGHGISEEKYMYLEEVLKIYLLKSWWRRQGRGRFELCSDSLSSHICFLLGTAAYLKEIRSHSPWRIFGQFLSSLG